MGRILSIAKNHNLPVSCRCLQHTNETGRLANLSLAPAQGLEELATGHLGYLKRNYGSFG